MSFVKDLEIDYLTGTMLPFQKKLRTESRNVILAKIYKKATWFEAGCLFKEN